jgi:hypothetical protein
MMAIASCGRRQIAEVETTKDEVMTSSEMPQSPSVEEWMSQLHADVALAVAEGFGPETEIVAKIVDIALERAPFDYGVTRAKKVLGEVVHEEIRKQRRAERDWPEWTDNDRLDIAFLELELLGILALQNFWCCSTCAHSAAADWLYNGVEYQNRHELFGYVFFHEQDTANAVQCGEFALGYDALELTQKAKVRVGRLVVKVLSRHGFKTRWNGDPDIRIDVLGFDWKKRRYTVGPAGQMVDWMRRASGGSVSVDKLRALLARGVPPDVYNPDGLTALHMACVALADEGTSARAVGQWLAAARALITAGATATAPTRKTDVTSMTPLGLLFDGMQQLRGPALTRRMDAIKQLVDMLVSAGESPDAVGHSGFGPLHVACKAISGRQTTPEDAMQWTRVVEALLDSGANPRMRTVGETESGDTPLHVLLDGLARLPGAALEERLPVARMLIGMLKAKGGYLNATNTLGLTPLMLFCQPKRWSAARGRFVKELVSLRFSTRETFNNAPDSLEYWVSAALTARRSGAPAKVLRILDPNGSKSGR